MMMEDKGDRALPSERAGGRCPEPAAQSQPSALIPSAEEREASIEAFYAVVRAAVSTAYAKQVKRGYTIEVMAARIGRPEAWIRASLLVSRETLRLDDLSEVCFAMNCDIRLQAKDGLMFICVYPMDEPPAVAEGHAPHPNQDTPHE